MGHLSGLAGHRPRQRDDKICVLCVQHEKESQLHACDMKLNIYFLFRINVSMPYIDLYSQLHTCTNKYDAHAELSKKLYNVTPRVLHYTFVY